MIRPRINESHLVHPPSHMRIPHVTITPVSNTRSQKKLQNSFQACHRVHGGPKPFTIGRCSDSSSPRRVHSDVTDGIRIVRRLDFTQPPRISATYDEHAKILKAILARRADAAKLMLRTHIEASKAEVRKITLHTLHEARARLTR
jgi:hypothetical protein